MIVQEWIKNTTQQEEELHSAKQLTCTSHSNGYDEQPVRKSIDLKSMFSSEKVTFQFEVDQIIFLHFIVLVLNYNMFIFQLEREPPMPVINTNSVYSLPLEASYSKWDKYDPDVELMKQENKEKIEKLQAQRRKNLNSSNFSVSLNDDETSHHDRVKSIKSYVDSISKSKQVSIRSVSV